MKVVPVILCGGSGTRLWPVSRKGHPKQFVPLIGGKSLLELTLSRVSWFEARPWLVASEEHRFLVTEAIESSGHVCGKIILEPAPRSTAAAMALAALAASPDDILLFCPADHYIPDSQDFVSKVGLGVAAAQSGSIVTFGVVPTFPSTGFGYILFDESSTQPYHPVRKFQEKPSIQEAEQLLLSGKALWNAGIFMCRAETLIHALFAHAPDIMQACTDSMSMATSENYHGLEFVRPQAESFLGCRAQSIDYAVMEHFQEAVVVPFSGQWSDVGSWRSVAEFVPPDEFGNRVLGAGYTINSRDTFVFAQGRPVVALGTSRLMIIDTPDALLVADESQAEYVKDVVAQLESAGVAQVATHRRVARPWGWYDSIEAGERFQVKRICVRPGASLSLQFHRHRAEHWVVVSGVAEVTCGDQTFTLLENQSTYIPVGQRHRLKNVGDSDLDLIEIQSGSYLGEDDIVRLEDVYGRDRGMIQT